MDHDTNAVTKLSGGSIGEGNRQINGSLEKEVHADTATS
jgi:hypothetical protein